MSLDQVDSPARPTELTRRDFVRTTVGKRCVAWLKANGVA